MPSPGPRSLPGLDGLHRLGVTRRQTMSQARKPQRTRTWEKTRRGRLLAWLGRLLGQEQEGPVRRPGREDGPGRFSRTSRDWFDDLRESAELDIDDADVLGERPPPLTDL